MLSFAVCYGLVLQGLGQSTLSTNLLPREIVTDRLIREKKPWAVAMVAALLVGMHDQLLRTLAGVEFGGGREFLESRKRGNKRGIRRQQSEIGLRK